MHTYPASSKKPSDSPAESLGARKTRNSMHLHKYPGPTHDILTDHLKAQVPDPRSRVYRRQTGRDLSQATHH